ncbi:uncharacterized protein LOC135925031 isoform X2 [Gordionus sp. m RMFG-2023]|uniref:uncharacterized protein LOC135925031 isoform X2 n=1 Tax=Gordionus sp. m RMFG-2023 TaxID=3053472 RepID=UPI0031FCD9FE
MSLFQPLIKVMIHITFIISIDKTVSFVMSMKNMSLPKLPEALKHKNDECFERNIKTQDDFNITEFMGVWIAIAQTIPINEYILESGITAHLHKGGKFFQVKHAGYIKEDCVGPSILESWEDPNHTGYIHSHFMNDKGEIYFNVSFKVVYTDYSTSILYTCHKFDSSGQICLPEYTFVSINARNKDIPKLKWCQILSTIKSHLCVDPKKLYIISRRYDCKHKLELEKGIVRFESKSQWADKSGNRVKRSVETMKMIHKECLNNYQ